jgi:hypothetical protein
MGFWQDDGVIFRYGNEQARKPKEFSQKQQKGVATMAGKIPPYSAFFQPIRK